MYIYIYYIRAIYLGKKWQIGGALIALNNPILECNQSGPNMPLFSHTFIFIYIYIYIERERERERERAIYLGKN